MKMYRRLEVAAGIGVLIVSMISSGAVFQMAFVVLQSPQPTSHYSIIYLFTVGIAVALSYTGAFLLLSWGIKR
jgi:hypothetical protein